MESNRKEQQQLTRTEKEARLAGMYEEYFDKIAHYAYARIGDKTIAEDIAGEVFLKALESIKGYEERGLPIEAWLFKIAHNRVVDHFREVAKTNTVPIDEVAIKDERDDPQKVTETNMEVARVTAAMKQLTQEQAEVIRLRFMAGMGSREVAEILGKTDGAVREMQRAAVEKMRKLLDVDNQK